MNPCFGKCGKSVEKAWLLFPYSMHHVDRVRKIERNFSSQFYSSLRGYFPREHEEKSRIRETKHLSTDADSSTDTTVG